MPIPLHLRQQLSSAPSTMTMTMNPLADDDLIALPFDEYILISPPMHFQHQEPQTTVNQFTTITKV